MRNLVYSIPLEEIAKEKGGGGGYGISLNFGSTDKRLKSGGKMFLK